LARPARRAEFAGRGTSCLSGICATRRAIRRKSRKDGLEKSGPGLASMFRGNLRAGFVTSVAVNAVTTQQHAVAARGAASAPAGDPFAAVLDEIVQDAGNDNASVAAPTGDPSDAAAAPNDPSQASLHPGKKLPTDRLRNSDPTTVPSLLPPQQDTATPVVAAKVPAAQDDDADAATRTVPVADASGARAAAGTPPKASGDTAVRHAHRDSGRHTHQAASHSEDANTLSVAALQAAAEIVLGAPVAATDTATPASTAVPKLTAPTAAAATPVGTADAVPTDIVASAMLSSGATVKPATTTATKPQSDSTKTQIRQSAAATLADASKAVGHAFSDPRAGNAAPAHVAMNDQTPHAPAASGASAPVPPDSSVQQPAATPAPPAAPHLQAPPQPSAAM